MKPHIPLLVGLLISTPAFAWDNTNNGHNNQIVDGGSGAQSNARSSAASQSHAKATTGPVAASGGTSGASVALSGVGGSSVRSGPTVFVPDGAGQAPCGGGLGGGAGAASAGASAGGTLWEFGDCKRMRESAALRSLAVETGDTRLQQAALNELCQIDRIRDAFGGACPVLAQPMSVIQTDAGPGDYCFTRNAGDANQHRECTRTRRAR